MNYKKVYQIFGNMNYLSYICYNKEGKKRKFFKIISWSRAVVAR